MNRILLKFIRTIKSLEFLLEYLSIKQTINTIPDKHMRILYTIYNDIPLELRLYITKKMCI